ncbi:MAG: hypothetical protein FWB74_03170 [Defluviitaleaceae bacterium]|nr:hypothetical protein [Defluviitaleaceae bacterium]
MSKMSRKTSTILGIAILIIGVVGIAAVFWHAYRVTAATERPFVHERRQSAERLYRYTLGRDMENNYPRTPRELMDLYSLTVQFLYGDFIALDSMFMRVIEFQRSLFTAYLRSIVPAETQFYNLQASLYELQYHGILGRRAEVYEFTIDYVYERHALIEVRHRFMLHDDLFRVYHLSMDDDDRWRIASWALADQYFNIVE